MALDKIKKTVKGMLAKPKPSKGDALWSLLLDKYEVGSALRVPWEQRWLIDLAFFVGKQYVFFNGSANMLQQLQEIKGRIRNVDNKLLPKVQKKIAREISRTPEMSVVPRTNDQDDIDAAKLGDKVLKAWWRNIRMPKKYRQMATWRAVCGSAFFHDFWSPKKGPIERSEKGGLVYAGDVDIEVLSPFNLMVPYGNLGDDELNEFPWVMIVRAKNLEWFPKNFLRGEEVTAEQIPVQYFEAQQLFGLNSSAGSERLKRARDMELFILPCPDYPKGKWLEGANGIVLRDEDYPYDFYPIEQFRDIYVPGVFWGVSQLDQAIGLQKTWNRTISGFDEFNRVMGKGKGLAPKGCELEALPDDTHGEWLSYKPVMGHKPEHMTLKGLPDTYDKLLAITGASLEDQFSQHEVSRGTNKSDIRSGYMVQLLLEQDAEPSVPTAAETKDSLEVSASRVLRRIKDGYKTKRILQIPGSEGQYEIFSFMGADLKDNTDVSVVKDLSVPDSRSAREAQIMDKYQQGLYGPAQDPEVRREVLQMIEDAGSSSSFTEVRLDEQNARYENVTLTAGQISGLMVNTYDNHAVHTKEHNKARKGRRYQIMKVENPQMFGQVEQLFEVHNRMHLKLMAEQIQAATAVLPEDAGAKQTNAVPMKGGGRI